MKKIIYIFLALLLNVSVYAQAPQSFKYQAIARDDGGQVLDNKNVSFKISILQGSTTGTSVYTETFATTTNQFGLVNLNIGTGTTTDDFSAINWSVSTYFVQIEMDQTGGSNYQLMGTSQLLSVPYALHAKTAENIFSGNYYDLSNTPDLSNYDTDVTDDFNGNYNNLTNTPDLSAYLTNETDPVFIAHVANGITSTNITNWNNAYNWGDHSAVGYLTSYTETDPVFIAHAANGITSTNITNWNNAYNWGDHSTAGYLTSYTETDPVFIAHVANGITSTNITNWNNAYNWGDHSAVGYLTNYTETDPVFIAHAANGITSTNITNWNNAYNWGDHSTAGYLTSYTETDPIYSAWDKSTGITITESQISDLNHFTNTDETDQVFVAWNKSYKDLINTPNIIDSITTVLDTSTQFVRIELDDDVTNEIQDLSLSGNTLSLSDDATTIDLSAYLDNTDDQSLEEVLSQNNDAGGSNIVNTGVIGIGIAAPDASAALEINSSTQGFLPPKMTDAQMISISNPAAGLQIYNTDSNIPLYYNGTEWRKLDGSEYLYIGKSYAGGIIFYLDANRTSGFVCSESDQSANTPWGCEGTAITGADGIVRGTGQQNTLDIVAGCTTAGIAAQICNDLSLNSYTDWFLPSKDELNLMYTNLHQYGLGSFVSTYICSSELNDDFYWAQNFSNGNQYGEKKNYSGTYSHVRAVRTF